MVGVKNAGQNERYVSGIFNNEEKICNKYSNIPCQSSVRRLTGDI